MSLDQIKRFRDDLLTAGLETSTTLSSKDPRSRISAEGGKEVQDDNVVFQQIIVEDEILAVCRDAFISGMYNIAVTESFKAVDVYVSRKAKLPKQSGTAMMEVVFSPNSPKLSWSERLTKSEEDEQKGYQRLFAGAMLGIRNPTTHVFDWVDDPDTALELIVFAQHLLRKAKTSAA